MSQIEPTPSRFSIPDLSHAGGDDVVAVGGDLEPGTVLAAYRVGVFPMHLPEGPLAWWSPSRRGILPLDGLRVTRSLRRSMRRYTVTVDRAFNEVISACADPARPSGWITAEIRSTYAELHRLGWVHSVESWIGNRLVGGLYGVAIGGLFAGESMFHRESDASKVALVRLVERMNQTGGQLLDVQWATGHLETLGAVEVGRPEYRRRLRQAIEVEPKDLWPSRR